MFLGLTTFYLCFIQSFSKIAAPLIPTLKINKSSDKSAWIAIGANVDKVISDGLKFSLPESKKTKMTKSKNLAKLKNSIIGAIRFLISETRIAFTQLR